jgi:hypothetical protein
MEVAIPCILEGVDSKESGAVGKTGESVGIFYIGMFSNHKGDGVLDTQSVDIFSKRNTMVAMDGVDDVILGGVKMLRKHEDRQVWIQEGMFFLYIFIQLTHQKGGIPAAAGADGQALGPNVNSVDRAADIEKEKGQRETVGKEEPSLVSGIEYIGELAKEQKGKAEVGGDIDTLKVKILETVGGIELGVDALETDELANAGDKDKKGLKNKYTPEKVEVDDNNEVVSPVTGKEAPRRVLEPTRCPEAILVGPADKDRDNHEHNTKNRREK